MNIEHSRVIGLTGPMGSGKSTISKRLAEQGLKIVDYDLLVIQMYDDAMFCLDLDDEWGLIKGQPVKPQMTDMITQFPDRLKRLEQISKPWLDRLIDQALTQALLSHPFVIFDCPLLYEGGWDDMCEYVILVTANDATRRERIMQRPGMTQVRMLILMDRQLKANDEQRLDEAGWIINTDGTIDETLYHADRVAASLKKFYA